MSVSVHMHAFPSDPDGQMLMHVEAQRTTSAIGTFQVPSTLFCETGSLLGLGLTTQVGASPWEHLSLTPQHWDCKQVPPHLMLMKGLGKSSLLDLGTAMDTPSL